MKPLILSCLVAFTLTLLAGCASDERHSSTETSTMMSVDSKDMHHRSSNNGH